MRWFSWTEGLQDRGPREGDVECCFSEAKMTICLTDVQGVQSSVTGLAA
jgi:hypothetical protein